MYLNIKMQIIRLGVHQNDIARALGMGESLLSKIIHGYREPSKKQREQLAGFLKVEESWLFENYERAVRNSITLPRLVGSGESEPISVARNKHSSKIANPGDGAAAARLPTLKPEDEGSMAADEK